MLPKVASHLHLHVSRAAAASQSIRNALQFQSSPTAANAGSIGWAPGPSSSSWGSSAGGAKQNAGSRFYNSYTHSTGRALTQANSSTSHDGNTAQTDADEERKLHKRPVAFGARGSRSLVSRTRSTSVSLISGASPLGQKLGVLEVVQIHARSRHAFAQNPNEVALSDDANLIQDHDDSTTTSGISHSVPEVPPSPPLSPDVSRIIDASMANNEDLTLSLVKAYLSNTGPFSTAEFNACLNSILHFYRPESGRPLLQVLEIYREMVEQGLQPDRDTYAMLINGLCARDAEVINLLEHLIARREPTSLLADQLTAEDNFDQARTLFTSAAASSLTLDATTCCSLLSSCAARGDVDMAIKVYAHLEASGRAGICEVYQHLINVYSAAKDIDGAVEVFQEFRRLSEAGQITWAEENGPISKQGRQVLVWNRMIRAYLAAGQPAQGLGLLEQMMDSQAGLGFGLGEVPLPSLDTYSTVIGAFLEAGDIQSGLSWFNRLLAQAEPSLSHHEPVLAPHKPDELTWSTVMLGLAKHGRLHDLNQLYPVMVESTRQGHIQAIPAIQQLVISANTVALESKDLYSRADIKFITDLWTNVIAQELFGSSSADFSQAFATIRALATRDHKQSALAIASAVLRHGAVVFEGQKGGPSAGSNTHLNELRKLASVLPQCLLHESPGHSNLNLRDALNLGSLCLDVGSEPNAATCMLYIRSFAQSRRSGEDVQLGMRDWEILVAAFALAARGQGRIAPLPGFVFPGLRFLLDDMARCNINPANLDHRFSMPLLFAMINSFGVQQGIIITSSLGEPFKIWFTSMVHKDSTPYETNDTIPPPPHREPGSSQPTGLVVDRQVSRLVDEHAQVRGSITPLVAFERFRASAARGLAPGSDVFARLIGALGRQGEIEKVKELYTAAQGVLNCVNDRYRSGGWFQLEDSMVIAFAHARDLESANIHRERIIGSGGQPSADAYAALILCIKDTTDDASAAMELFEESQRLQVRPNTFLYNNIISKLARARKADHALELFRRMKEAGLRPTAITYGALIGACARVGDAASAEVLFAEMTSQPNFRPRIPPYNTMMQLYVSTKPDRDRAFYYFNAMLDAGIQPSEHTYKLLLDFYGNMEPIDLKSVEDVFLRLQSDRQVQINGTHWAALITAYGCSAKDLNKALEIFESIPSHPSSARANPALPDALVYEGLMSVLVTLQRADLLPVYLDKMMAANVRPTAYVYNLLIKGYATMDIELARRTFEELQDPPVGVAAPNNHAGSLAVDVSPEGAVYREPSTWEAMVRAELGYGDRERALLLVERMQSRNFPEAVVNRVRGIFLDEAPLDPSATTHSTAYLLDNSSIASSPSLHEATA